MTITTTELAPPRKRAGGKKSRTGCRTCRTRRIKCDEAPGACQKCTSTGRSCDYDLQRLPRRGNTKAVIAPELASGFCWPTSSDERQCFFNFQHHGIHNLHMIFESPLWEYQILQMCQSDPAVYHAAIALSAIAHDSMINGLLLPWENRENAWVRFAMEQSVRSFSLLNQRRMSQDPRLREVVLSCCLIFTLLAIAMGDYAAASVHLKGGLKIVQELKARKKDSSLASSAFVLERSLLDGFAHLELSAVCVSMKTQDEDLEDQRWAVYDVDQDRQALDVVISDVFRFLTYYWHLSPTAIKASCQSLHSKQKQLLQRLERFENPIELLYAKSHARIWQKLSDGSDVIYLLHRALIRSAKSCLLQCDPTRLDTYTSQLNAARSLVEDMKGKFPKRPNVTMDLGVIPSIIIIAVGCPEEDVRSQALKALSFWPQHEDLYRIHLRFVLSLEYARLREQHLIPMPPGVDESSCQPADWMIIPKHQSPDISREIATSNLSFVESISV